MRWKSLAKLALVCMMALTAALPAWAAPAAPTVVDLALTNIEVTQGMQDLNNSMPLVAKRRTIVRVYAKNNTGTDVSGVRAQIKVYRLANNTWTPLGTLKAKNNALKVLANGGQRLRLNDSYWFYLPYEWRTGRVRIDAEINYDNVFDDNTPGNDYRSVIVDFKAANPLNLMMVPLHLHGNGGTYFCGDNCKQIIPNVLRFHPINELNSWAFSESIAPAAHWLGDDWNVNSKKDRSKMLDRLDWARFWRDDPASDIHYYGMIHPDAGAFGLGRMSGSVALGTMNNVLGDVTKWHNKGGTILAHELGHNKGLKHVNCAGNESSGGEVDPSYPWPFPNCQLASNNATGFYGMDVYYEHFGLSQPTVISNNPNAARPQLGYPMMGYQDPGYISPWEYCKLLPKYGVPCSWPLGANRAGLDQPALTEEPMSAGQIIPPAAQAEVAALRSADDYLLIAGVVDDATGAVELEPWYQRTVVTPGLLQEAIDARVQAANNAQGSLHQHNDGSVHRHPAPANQWKVAVFNAAGATVYSQTLAFDQTSHDGDPITGIASLIPLPTGSQRVSILRNGVMVAERQRSANPPTVQIDEPLPAMLQAGAVLRWTSRDVDAGSVLRHTVLYSPDNGVSWYPLAFDTPNQSLALTAEMLQSIPGSASARLKIVATDGYLTGEDVTTSPTALANNRPEGMITGPSSDLRFNPGEFVLFEATATDWEDGALDGSALVWSSNRDGQLGTGREIGLDTLTTGHHVITLTTTDSGGATHQTSVGIDIHVPYVYAPFIQR